VVDANLEVITTAYDELIDVSAALGLDQQAAAIPDPREGVPA
jgi:hypothetical protein